MRLERDKRTRITVGARMSREEAEYYRKVATMTSRSLHQMTKDALYAECLKYGVTPFEPIPEDDRPPWR